MVKPIPSWLKSFNPAASTSKKETPTTESSSKAKKEDRKEDPPVSPRPASPPPGYATVAPGAMPAGSSRAIVRRGDHDGDGHGYDGHQDDYEDDFNDKKGKAIVRRGTRGGDEDKYGASRRRRDDFAEDDRDDRKGREIVRRGKSRRDPSESESESDRGHRSKKKGKEVVKRGKDSKKKSKKSKKQESSSESDSDEQIVEKRQRFEAISAGELSRDYVEALRRCFEVRVEKIEKWCDDGLIRMDTKDGSFNADKLLNSKKVEEDEKKKWAVLEKRYRRHIAETPGGDMNRIPRFQKHLKKGPSRGQSGPSVIVVSGSREPRYRSPDYGSSYYGRSRSPSLEPGHGVPRPFHFLPCTECEHCGFYCGDPWHRRGLAEFRGSEYESY